MSTGKRTEAERFVAVNNRWFRYSLLSAVSFFTLLDIVKQDAYNSALLDYLLPNERNAKQISGILVLNDVSVTALQMCIIGLIEHRVQPTVWCTFNLFVTIVGWLFFAQPNLSLGGLICVFCLRAANVRYAMMVHWFGPLYYKYTMAVQFFISVLPYIVKLPLFHYYRRVVFDCQLPFAYGAAVLLVLLVCMFLGSIDSTKTSPRRYATLPLSDRIIINVADTDDDKNNNNNNNNDNFVITTVASPDKQGSWTCNIACSLFLAGVYYDFRMFDTYANQRLGYTFTYDMVYVHVGLFVTVFLMNLSYNLFKFAYRRWLTSRGYQQRALLGRMQRTRYYFVLFSYIGAIVSRVAFLFLQLSAIDSFTCLAICVCLGGLGGNVQPLLAEFMFRQRCTGVLINSLYRVQSPSDDDDRRCCNFVKKINVDQLFKWFYVDGRNLVNLPLLLLWLIVWPVVGSWWFTANTIVLLFGSFGLFLFYYFAHGLYIDVAV